jgi:hypothetical protein
MPENQSQLWDLLALLAQFQKRGLASGRLHKLGYPFQDAPIFVRHANVSCLDVVCWSPGNSVVARQACAIVGRKLLVVLALRSRLDSLGLLLGMQLGSLRLMLSMLGDVMLRLLVVALTPLAVLLLMREEMLHWLRVVTGLRVLWSAKETE